MYVDDFEGESEIASAGALLACLERRPVLDANHFILSFEASGFPQLSFFVRGDACVAYFMETGKNFVSSSATPIDGAREQIFYENRLGGEVRLSSACIISAGDMMEAAKAFFAMRCRPACLSWMEL